MSAHELIRAYGIGVRFTNLGDWGPHELRSEYDPAVPEIRIHAGLRADLIELALGHELYHHREAIGEVAILPTRAQREAAADAYAHRLRENTG